MINIAEILKNKQKGINLWSNVVGTCIFDYVTDDNNIKVTGSEDSEIVFSKYGEFYKINSGLCNLFPSPRMHAWNKFTWKRGDVLKCGAHSMCIFTGWEQYTDGYDYVYFFGVPRDRDEFIRRYKTSEWEKASEEESKIYIDKIEKYYEGKLNIETFEIEKKSKFKDGDICVLRENGGLLSTTLIIKSVGEHSIDAYAYGIPNKSPIEYDDECPIYNRKLRLATKEEKQEFFDALAEDNKAWDAEKKQIVDLPKKGGFKPKDWCLMRDEDDTQWALCQFSHRSGKYTYAVGGVYYEQCIPYNNQTVHLLGTTDDWKGDEE